jgi:hypothetical protein
MRDQDTCSLTTTQLKDKTVSPSPPVVTFGSIKVSLLITCHRLLWRLQQAPGTLSPGLGVVTASRRRTGHGRERPRGPATGSRDSG